MSAALRLLQNVRATPEPRLWSCWSLETSRDLSCIPESYLTQASNRLAKAIITRTAS